MIHNLIESGEFSGRQVWIERLHHRPHIGRKRSGRTRGTDDKLDRVPIVSLPEVQIHFSAGWFLEPAVPHVSDPADDPRLAVHIDDLSDRVPVRPETPRHRFVDYDHFFRFSGVTLIKIAAGA